VTSEDTSSEDTADHGAVNVDTESRIKSPAFDINVAHQARVYDYMLGGKDNFAADRAYAEAAIKVYPGLVSTARANRAFLGRAVRYLGAVAGIRQFVDIGTGIPAAGSTHEVARQVAPDFRIVYVDHDPIVLAHARALLVSGGRGTTDYIDADLRAPETILERAARTLDFSRPVAVLLFAVLHTVMDDENPHAIVARLMDAMPSGSYLALSHLGAEFFSAEATAQMEQMSRGGSRQQYVGRSEADVRRFFDGLELVPPGLVSVEDWRPDRGATATGDAALWAGVALKP
jgi:S-adenosyl methyltransferase